MQDYYIKTSKRELENIKKRTNKLLIQNIINTHNLLKVAMTNYEFAEDELIDYYLYEIKANQAKLDYLIKESKKNGIELDRIEKIQIIYQEEDQVV